MYDSVLASQLSSAWPSSRLDLVRLLKFGLAHPQHAPASGGCGGSSISYLNTASRSTHRSTASHGWDDTNASHYLIYFTLRNMSISPRGTTAMSLSADTREFVSLLNVWLYKLAKWHVLGLGQDQPTAIREDIWFKRALQSEAAVFTAALSVHEMT